MAGKVSHDAMTFCLPHNFAVYKTFLNEFEVSYARRTLELSSQLSGIRDCLHKLFPQVCGGLLYDFLHWSC